MKDRYRHLTSSVSMINYHIVFCPRYRRKIFLVDGVEARFRELVRQICERNDISILAMECHVDHCHLFLNVPPKYSAADVVRIIKTNTAVFILPEFFPQMPNLWTRSYFASTAGDVSAETIRQYVESQKTRS